MRNKLQKSLKEVNITIQKANYFNGLAILMPLVHWKWEMNLNVTKCSVTDNGKHSLYTQKLLKTAWKCGISSGTICAAEHIQCGQKCKVSLAVKAETPYGGRVWGQNNTEGSEKLWSLVMGRFGKKTLHENIKNCSCKYTSNQNGCLSVKIFCHLLTNLGNKNGMQE